MNADPKCCYIMAKNVALIISNTNIYQKSYLCKIGYKPHQSLWPHQRLLVNSRDITSATIVCQGQYDDLHLSMSAYSKASEDADNSKSLCAFFSESVDIFHGVS